MNTSTINKSKELWAYLSGVKMPVVKPIIEVDVVIVCCSYDLRVCDHACDLIKSGHSDKLLISGKTGNWTKHIWSEAESAVFRERAIKNGIDPVQIILEAEATNFGENICFAKELIPDATSAIFVSKPNSLLRVKLTAQSQWPEIQAYLSCPNLGFPADVSSVVGVLGVINEMVGDVERIQKYSEMGFQAHHSLPQPILDAWQYLVDQGFTEHLLADTLKRNGVEQF